MSLATDKKRWDELHAAQSAKYETRRAYELELGSKHGHHFEPQWLKKGERDKLEKLRAAEDKIGDKIVELLVRVSPRGQAWLSGVPAHWIRWDLTWEDAIRPKNEPLSVTPPSAWGGGAPIQETPMARRTVQAISKYQDYEVDVLDINGRTYTYTIRKVQTTSHAVKKALKMHGPTATWAGNVRGYQALQETPMTQEHDAEAAGAEYAAEQLGAPEGHGQGGTFFMDWVRSQLIEASRMDPSTVLPLETEADARVIARNMLKQLEWDTKRDLEPREIADLIGVDRTTHEDVKEFFKGFSETLRMNDAWLAGELLEINRELRSESGVGEARRRGRPPQRRGGMRESSSPIDVLRTLQPGDMVTVESPDLPRPRKLVVTNTGSHEGTYAASVSSGKVRPGHRGGGSIYTHRGDDEVFYQATMQQQTVRVTRLTRIAAAMAESRRGPEPVEDPEYVIQGIYAGGVGGGIISDSFGFDDEDVARSEAWKLSKSPYFEGDYVRIITRDGELVWDSRGKDGMREPRRGARPTPTTGPLAGMSYEQIQSLAHSLAWSPARDEAQRYLETHSSADPNEERGMRRMRYEDREAPRAHKAARRAKGVPERATRRHRRR
jgi:hypothetical protein